MGFELQIPSKLLIEPNFTDLLPLVALTSKLGFSIPALILRIGKVQRLAQVSIPPQTPVAMHNCVGDQVLLQAHSLLSAMSRTLHYIIFLMLRCILSSNVLEASQLVYVATGTTTASPTATGLTAPRAGWILDRSFELSTWELMLEQLQKP